MIASLGHIGAHVVSGDASEA